MTEDIEVPGRLVCAAERLAATRQGAWLVINVLSPIDRFVMRRTKGRQGSRARGNPKLLLHHVGAKTGQARQTPLMCLSVDDYWLIVASKGGAPNHPAWYFNIKAHPAVTIDLNGQSIPVQARELEGAEYHAAWRLATSRFKGFYTYQARAGGRRIPLIRLDRSES
ncbi:nitroreductase/quinone reductase family protein [Amycolatopsis pigmentata]|uniref:Nitroreductase/quinone reductase family protein n=1 Tax=Amycolatopsis pigmentata TaxID=450801 RepID=A0ABW5G8P6_9PSEU